MLAARVRLLIAALWAGSLWTVGYLVAPTLFVTLHDRALAGTIAGRLFRIEAWLSVACALALLLLIRFAKSGENVRMDKHLFHLVIAMLACTVVGYFGLQPFMAALREAAGPGGTIDPGMKTEFALLHGVSSAFYLVQSLLGVALVLKVR
jgi:hypothetical protein